MINTDEKWSHLAPIENNFSKEEDKNDVFNDSQKNNYNQRLSTFKELLDRNIRKESMLIKRDRYREDDEDENFKIDSQEPTPEGISSQDFKHASDRVKRKTQAKIDSSYKDLSVLGFGVYSFFYILEMLMILFAVLSLLSFFTMFLYSYYGDSKYSTSLFDYIEMGNLGYSSSFCKDVPLGVGQMTVDCPTGVISQIESYGVTPSNGRYLDGCKPNEDTWKCEGVYSAEYVQEYIEEECIGRKSCLIETRSFVDLRAEPPECVDYTSQFFIQLFCYLPEKELENKLWINKILTYEVIGINVLLLAFCFYVSRSLNGKYIEWDHKTTTISDYTVKFDIPDELYEKYIDYIYDLSGEEVSGESQVYAFKKFLRDEIVAMLKDERPAMADDDSLLDIVDIQFTFKHYRLIPLMVQRGRAIWDENTIRRKEIENKILYEYSSSFTTPIEAYIIFENEEAYQRSLGMNNTRICCFNFTEHHINVQKVATTKTKEYDFSIRTVIQPTNIKYENKHKSRMESFFRWIIAIFIIGIVMVIGFSLLFLTQQTKDLLRRSYPEVDCELLAESYSSESMLLRFAVSEWYNIDEQGISRESILKLSTSNLQCFCKNLQSELGYREASQKSYKVQVRGRLIDSPLCKDYLFAEKIVILSIVLAPAILEAINFGIRTVINFSMSVLRMENKTIESSTAMVIDFMLTFFNSSIVILLMNANFRETGLPFTFLNGYYGDFNAKWYALVAPIFITPMFIRCILPPVMMVVGWGLKRLFLLIDQREYILSKICFSNLDRNEEEDRTLVFTNKKTNLEFANLRSGDKLNLHSPYSQVLVAIMICFMYGLGLPILFPLTFCFIVVIYLTYKIGIVYWYQKPPHFESALSTIFLYNLKYASLFFCGFSYWMLCNRQMFDNHVLGKESQDEVEYNGHSIYYVPGDHRLLLLFFFFVCCAYIWLYEVRFDCFNIVFSSSVKQEASQFEGLRSFYKSLSYKNLINWIYEEALVRNQFGYKKLFDSTYERLLKEQGMRGLFKKYNVDELLEKGLFEESSYDILALPEYYEQLGYLPIEERNESNHKKEMEPIINDTKRLFDYPYFRKFQNLKNIFNSDRQPLTPTIAESKNEREELFRDFEKS
ncbi:unnamed protein product [Moneuplotes crassus]|uniref:Uncharacterized protein n=1 Tax=Euplotes crassus TaxID=5936 RepID=A0AAD1UK02_EUPCR|nr:unnamed protein product [Moneuplotes crassus]